MAQIVVTLTATAKQVTRLEKALIKLNATRLTIGLSPFASVSEWIESECVQLLKNHIESQRMLEVSGVRTAYAEADETVQAQINALLGLT